MKFTPISEIGRQALIDRIKAICVSDKEQTLIGIGDDAAMIAAEANHNGLLSSETLVEGIDFDISFHPLSHLGFKLISLGVSDILAMRGLPKHVLVNLNITTKFSVEMIEEFYRGVKEACAFYDCDLIGGDLRSSRGAAVLSVTTYGSVKSSAVTTRRTAKNGDAICVTGSLGEALAGLKILLRERKFWEDNPEASKPDLEVWRDVVSKQLIPKARIEIIRDMIESNIKPSSMIDLSKGFLNELKELCTLSNTGAYVYEAALPITEQTKDVASEMGELASAYALQGGEDVELMFTLPEDAVDKAFEIFKDITVVGMIRPSSEGIQIQKFTGEVWEIESDQ